MLNQNQIKAIYYVGFDLAWVCLVQSPPICCVSVVDGCGGGGFDECGCVCGVGFVTDVVGVVRGCNGGGC